MGPGTHVRRRILSGIRPTSQPDWVAARHDVDYLRGGEWNGIAADLKAIIASDYSFQGIVMKLGLGLRTGLDILSMSTPLHKLTHFNGSRFSQTQIEEIEEGLARMEKTVKW